MAAGFCSLCLVAAIGVVAQGASAKGTTSFTCKKKEGGGVGFSKSHCRPTDAVATGAQYSHVPIAPNTATELKISGETTNGETEALTLKLSTAFEVNVGAISGVGVIENSFENPEEHFVRGETALKFNKVSVTSTLFKGCKIFSNNKETNEPGAEGEFETEPLAFTTKAQGDSLRVETKIPAEPRVFAKFWIGKCAKENTFEHQYVLVGSVNGVPDGATLKFTHAQVTEQKSLKIGAAVVGINGSLTLSGKDVIDPPGSFTPLSFTTVETP